jgi:hypothetical protein
MFEIGSTAHLIWGLIFGSIGTGFAIYGKKQRAIVPLTVGIVLCVFPYFITNLYLLVFVGLVLMAIPYLVRV